MPRDWSLEGSKKARRARGCRRRASAAPAHSVHAPAPACPACGFVYPIMKREIATVEGELAELSGDRLLRLKNAPSSRLLTAATTPEALKEIVGKYYFLPAGAG
jgi:hypothetical protein